MSLGQLIVDVAEVRDELRKQSATVEAIDAATERIVRHYWEPLVPPRRAWPPWMTIPLCAYCDGTGLVIHRHVRNRLGCFVNEGEPCRCPLGQRFLAGPTTAPDHTQAGKTPKPKQLSRFGR